MHIRWYVGNGAFAVKKFASGHSLALEIVLALQFKFSKEEAKFNSYYFVIISNCLVILPQKQPQEINNYYSLTIFTL